MGIHNTEGYHRLPPENGEFNLLDLSVAVPPDQIRMIENIKTLISEVRLCSIVVWQTFTCFS